MMPHSLPPSHNLDWLLAHLWNLVGGGVSIALTVIGWLFKESIKQMAIDWFIKRFKKSEKKIKEEVKKEIDNGGTNSTSGTNGDPGTKQ